MSSDEAARRARRRNWPIAKFRMGEEPSDDLSDSTSAAERIAMMWPLAQAAWAVAGKPLPTYDRQQTPARLFQPRLDPSPRSPKK